MAKQRANGTGFIKKLKDKKRKNPYAVYKPTIYTIDENGKKKRIQEAIGYYPNKKIADEVLAKFNLSLHNDDIVDKKILLKDVMEQYNERVKSLKGEVSHSYRHALSYKRQFKSIEDLQICKLKFTDYQKILDLKSRSSQRNLICYVRNFYKLAMKLEYIYRNEGDKLENSGIVCQSKEKSPLSGDEVRKLWDLFSQGSLSQQRWARMCLIILYTGMRVGEYMALKINDVDLDERVLYITKSKTNSGVRTVAIRDEIKPLLQYLIDNRHIGNPDFINDRNQKINSISTVINRFLKESGFNHTIHEFRHTFLTRAFNQNVKWDIIEKQVGHKIGSVGKDVYVHLSNQALKREVDKIDFFNDAEEYLDEY